MPVSRYHYINGILLSVCIALTTSAVQAQNVYIPRNLKQAYQKGTRSMDGKPGKNYWQNFARYRINITAAPPNRTIQGIEEISYVNNSPDTLRFLVFKLFLNSHRPGAIRQQMAGSNYLTTGLHVDRYAENNITRLWPDVSGTVHRMPLTKPLMPHDSVNLSFDWHYDMSVQSGREGQLDSTTFYLAYFYPRVAVRDDYYGWDQLAFTEAQEFYSDFNDYTLNVTVPANYVVWSTGNLQNPSEVLQPTVARRLAESMQTDSVIHVATQQDMTARTVTVQKPTNTWRWTADYVPDVALCISNQYVWDASIDFRVD